MNANLVSFIKNAIDFSKMNGFDDKNRREFHN